MEQTVTIHVTREMVEYMLDLPPGMQIASDMRLLPASGEEPAKLVFAATETPDPGQPRTTEPGNTYAAHYEQNDNGVSLVGLIER